MQEIATHGGFTYTYVKASTYNDGVVSVINDDTNDAFFGAYFITTERSRIADFTVPLFEGGLTLIELKDSSQADLSWDYKIWIWSKPFENSVWAVLALMACFASGVFYFLEGGDGIFQEEARAR